MRGNMSIIGLQEEKCVGCNACVRVCTDGDAAATHVSGSVRPVTLI